MTDRMIPHPTRDDVNALLRRLREECCVTPILGIELEFYTDPDKMQWVGEALQPFLLQEQITLTEWKAEDGLGQWECAIEHGRVDELLPKWSRLVDEIQRLCEEAGAPFDCAPKPFHDQPASGLHLHWHLEGKAGELLFRKDEDKHSTHFAQAIAGMLRMLPASMVFFAQEASSYARFRDGEHVPAHVCWGMNNRSAALRIPEKKSKHKHIEHRVCGADADVTAAVWAMLVGLHAGLSGASEMPEPIYGMARDVQYDLPKLPMSVTEAERAFFADALMQDYVASLRA